MSAKPATLHVSQVVSNRLTATSMALQGAAKVPQPKAESAVPPRAFEVKHAVGSKTLPYEELKGEVVQTPD